MSEDRTLAPAGHGADAESFDFLAPPQGPGEIGRLGSYRVLKVLGQGGMGVVFQAEDTQLKRMVAMKVMLPALAVSGTAKQRFLREAQAAAAVEHDHIVAIYQVGEDRGVPFVAMPFLKGEPLDVRLQHQSKLPIAEVLRIGREAALGLAAAHARGLVHRDIKPGNIWLEARGDKDTGRQGDKETRRQGEKESHDPSPGLPVSLSPCLGGRVKILDFGLARPAGSETNLTQPGAIVGTPAYMAPEQAKGEPVDARSDLFSLGCVLYRIATGVLPFNGSDTIAILMAIATENPRPPNKINPEIPKPLSALIMSLLSKNRSKRPESADMVAAALAEIESDKTVVDVSLIGSGALPRGSRSRWPLWVGTAATAVIVLGAIAGFVVAMQMGLLKSGSSKSIGGLTSSSSSERDGSSGSGSRGDDSSASSASGSETVSSAALLTAPAALPGVRSWTIETRGPRREVTALAYPPVAGPLAVGSGDGMLRLYEPVNGDLVKILAGHTAKINAIAWSNDGRLVATGSADKTIRIWEVASGKTVHTILGLTDPPRALSWSPDGKLLAAALKGRKVWMWETDAAKALTPIDGGDEDVRTVSWSPKGQFLACGGSKVIALWDGKKIKLTIPLAAVEVSNWSPWSPDGRFLVLAQDNGRLHTWDVVNDKSVRDWEAHGLHTYAAAWSPDGKFIASTGFDGSVHIWDAVDAANKRVQAWGINGVGTAGRLAWSHDSKRIASGTGQNFDKVVVRDPDAKLIFETLGNSWGAASTQLSPDGKTLADVRFDGTVRFWDTATGQLGVVWQGLPTVIYQLAWSPDGSMLAAACWGKVIYVWDFNKRLPVGKKIEPDCDVRSMAWSPDGKLLAMPVEDHKAAGVFDVSTAVRKVKLDAPDPITVISWSADGKMLIAKNDTPPVGPRTVRVWDYPTGKLHALEGGKGHVVVAGFAPRGSLFVSGNADHVIRIWDSDKLDKGKELHQLKAHTKPIIGALWAPDGNTLATASDDNLVCIWDAGAGALRKKLAGLERKVEGGAWTLDSQKLALVSGNEIRAWDAGSGSPLQAFSADRGSGCSVHWSNDGKTIYSGRGNGTIAVWDAETGKKLCSLLALRAGKGIAITPEGHFRGPPGTEGDLVYVIETSKGQETFSPDDFARRFGWKNDPAQVRMSLP